VRVTLAFGTAAFVAVFLVVAGCRLTAVPRPLPADPAWRGGACLGVGLDAVLHGDGADTRITWATDRASGDRIELLWPLDHRARFSPTLEVLDERGRVVAREGDLLIGGCFDSAAPRVAWVSADDVRPPDWEPGDG
jgi:hypothetical protein